MSASHSLSETPPSERTLRPFRLRIALLAIAICAGAIACSKGPLEKTSVKGTWTGYLEFAGSTAGYNTMTIDEEKECSLVAEISGELAAWGGAYTLRIEGEPIIYYEQVIGDITIWRYRPGIDTVRTTGRWSGEFHLDTKVAWGSWMVDFNGPFSADGTWMASKQ